jgi:Ca2+-binding EF-hand superfamily protein
VSADKLRAAVREFELTLDVERVLREADADRSGFLDYAEFAAVLK